MAYVEGNRPGEKSFTPRKIGPLEEYKQTGVVNKYYVSWNDTYTGHVYQNSDKIVTVKGVNPCTTDLNDVEEPYRVLPNCVGYAVGRFHEIINNGQCSSLGAGIPVKLLASGINNGYAPYVTTAYSGLAVHGNSATIPPLGSLMVFGGHVVIVEQRLSATQLLVSESAYASGQYYPAYNYQFALRYVNLIDNMWVLGACADGSGKSGYSKSNYPYYGFCANPATSNLTYIDESTDGLSSLDIPPKSSGDSSGYSGNGSSRSSPKTSGGPISKGNAKKIAGGTEQFKEIQSEIDASHLKQAEYSGELNRTKSTNLLSTPSYVESPFIIVKIGDYTFGSYQKNDLHQKDWENQNVMYPNYMQSISIVKVNGTVNTYTIQMLYQIKPGDDPNLLDKVFSSVGYGKIYISYGDWSSPSFIYHEEEAIITKLTSQIDFSGSKISYILQCTSQAFALSADYHSFSATKAKPSDVIKNLIRSNKYGITDVFYGMKNELAMFGSDLIASDDRSVNLEAKYMDIISYINYLVSCMCSSEDDPENPIKTSSYYLSIYDNASNIVDQSYSQYISGPFFKVTKVNSETNTLSVSNIYEVDVGYPSDNCVMNFNIVSDNSWQLIYDYADKINQNNYSYKIDDNGELVSYYNPSITMDESGRNKENYRTWWTNMTRFPIKAELQIKGLIKPVMLMTYLRINSLFYGQRHISSGLYIITKQVDTINQSGYKTTLSLTRVGGDDDYITEMKKEPQKMSIWYPDEVRSDLMSWDDFVDDYATPLIGAGIGYVVGKEKGAILGAGIGYGIDKIGDWVEEKITGKDGK